MDKLEHYLDQVCRGIGGPRALRQHVRQELREHLRDAAAEYKAAGLPEGEALDRALEDFGGPEEVRSGLEATHGHRLLPVVIDKAMQWQERTMKAKWLWTTWAYLVAAAVIVLEVLFITFNVIFIVPKFNKLMQESIIDPAIVEEQGVSWLLESLKVMNHVSGNYTTFILIAAVAAVGLFEWRVKSENKPFMRLSALGTVATGLMVVVMLMAGALVISFCLGVPTVARLTRPFAVRQVAAVDAAVDSLEQEVVKKDWESMREEADRASQALGILANTAPLIPTLASANDRATTEERLATVDDLRAHVKGAGEGLAEARQAIRDKDADRLKAAVQKFRAQYGPIREAAAKVGS
jgi:hypothetical protein